MNRARKLPVSHRLALLAAAVALVSSEPSGSGSGGETQSGGRVVILGFDGADARTVRELMEKDPGGYPTFVRLAREGTFAPLEVVVPSESPVSWASLNSGQNPAKTGVPGFITRNLKSSSPLPGFGFIRKESARLESFEHTPIPLWNAKATAAVWGGVAVLLVLLLALLLLRRLWLAAILSLLAGAGAAWAGYRVRGMLPDSFPCTFNVNQARSFWDYAAEAGVPSIVLDAAEAFDADSPPNARVLHGLGLPDARNDIGQWFIYTSDPARFDPRELANKWRSTDTAGTVFLVDEEGGVARAKIYGPKNFWLGQELQEQYEAPGEAGARQQEAKERLAAMGYSKHGGDFKDVTAGRVSVDLEIRREGDRARVAIDGESQTLAVGQWSDFYSVTFELNWLLRVHAITRVRLIRLDPQVELLVNVLDIDPRHPPFWQAISSPFDFSAELARECGLFETYGWPTLTMPFKDEEIEPEVLLEDVEFTEHWREKLTHAALARDDWRCLMSVFSTADRVQHMTYQFYDAGHPLHDPAKAARETSFFGETIPLSEAVPAIYRQIDRIIGEVWAKLGPEDTLLVCSDHGFQSFRRQVHLNNWLFENGYLALKPGLNKDNDEHLRYVDWSKTRVYACGLGFLYLNLEEREPQGIVSREEARALIEEVREKLLAATDPDTGERFCREVYLPRDIHEGEHLDLEADLIPGFAPPYRVGWSTSSGGIHVIEAGDGGYRPGPICTNNDSNWSGDHLSMALQDVLGIFGSNRKVKIPPEGVRSLQIAPTVLQLLAVEVPPEMDLEPLEFE